ncbi:NAD-dependent epimerase/dehydratase family protein [Reyranella sp.]|uniref:NAD-dependent epimerase/dehydratase family protein n=1 Tax=Reyranella sp. TaxID=1929291 RepID=UPI000BC44639|nr:NAD-dependent epimerase/dehydratase family protein [Reyranella sp.]OYY45310.1 MAG: epimerase [Rhodospirillales bacterium 35-66-84]OYZ95776.1 MAG: epimerase [Rhodospirillales bacterium 24-66-33]OZB27294.1 MAG: epimerase [Rhodospirillales bacterium 39-66-50]HQT12699.1 NAD-dependent epimerase/dehydratase family protein [Reyranella sp.]
MKIFMTGATGYIGGTIARRLLDDGHEIRGLVRDAEKGRKLAVFGVEPVMGGLDDAAILATEASRADAVVNTANSDHRGAIDAFLEALAGSNKPFLHTSGSSIVADDAHGDVASERIYDEETPFEPVPGKQARVDIDRMIRDARSRGVRSIVVCPTMIYGNGLGLARDSAQIPGLVNRAKASGVVRHVGKGLNIWSNVHVEDVADLYRLALAKAPAGAFYFAENGEASYRDICSAIARRLKLGEPQAWPFEDAARELGENSAAYTFGSNSRVRARRARSELGWQPKHGSATEWIEAELPL